MNDVHVDSTQVIRLLKKYSIVLIVFYILSRLGMNVALISYYKYFSVEHALMYKNIISLITELILISMNFVVAILLLFDTNSSSSLRWLIFVLCLVSPWVAVPFLIMWKLVEVKSAPQT